MKTYNATVTREGKWWMVAIPEFNGITQARRLAEAGDMAREWIAVTLDVPIETVQVTTSVATVNGVDVASALDRMLETRKRAGELEVEARMQAIDLANALAAVDIPVRDIGAIMGVSFQRAHQLVTANT